MDSVTVKAEFHNLKHCCFCRRRLTCITMSVRMTSAYWSTIVKSML